MFYKNLERWCSCAKYTFQSEDLVHMGTSYPIYKENWQSNFRVSKKIEKNIRM
jgi:hypothetical protein